mgnify:CR=1 FL=1
MPKNRIRLDAKQNTPNNNTAETALALGFNSLKFVDDRTKIINGSHTDFIGDIGANVDTIKGKSRPHEDKGGARGALWRRCHFKLSLLLVSETDQARLLLLLKITVLVVLFRFLLVLLYSTASTEELYHLVTFSEDRLYCLQLNNTHERSNKFICDSHSNAGRR